MDLELDRTPSAESARNVAPSPEARLALLGLGRVGRAVAGLLDEEPCCLGRPARITAALVRSAPPERRMRRPVVEDAAAIFESRPDVVVEVLGGLEPARTIVRHALALGLPVITANKSLLAAHGDELIEVASRSGAAFRFEAAVIAGVPFLGTLARRPLAARVTGAAGVLNGTSNFVLTRMSAGATCAGALVDAQRLGLAEPDPSNDVNGTDAAEKLVVLLRHLAGIGVAASEVPRWSLDAVAPGDLEHARALGGTLKPVAFAEWTAGEVACASGPAFVHARDPLALLEGVENGIRLHRDGTPPLTFSGPGAGPEVTARTILDDVREVLDGQGRLDLHRRSRTGRIRLPDGAWYLRLRAPRLPAPGTLASVMANHGVWIERWSATDTRTGTDERRLLTFPCSAQKLHGALHALNTAAGCAAAAFPGLGSPG